MRGYCCETYRQMPYLQARYRQGLRRAQTRTMQGREFVHEKGGVMSKLNKAHGNMYDWLSHTWSPGRGCPHACTYCYVRAFGQQPREFSLDAPFPALGQSRKIFVGHMTDLFADGVPDDAIRAVLAHVRRFPKNQYVFQTKAPLRIIPWLDMIDKTAIIGTTIETDDKLLADYSDAPPVEKRAYGLAQIGRLGYSTFLTLEPLMEFNPLALLRLVRDATPGWVNIGADSKGHGLPEPIKADVELLLAGLRDAGITVKLKDNLERLI